MKTEIIRAYMLEPGDIFRKLGVTYKVMQVTQDKILYRFAYLYNYETKNVASTLKSMGKNSQERIELIADEDKPGSTGQLVINFKSHKNFNHGTDFESRTTQAN